MVKKLSKKTLSKEEEKYIEKNVEKQASKHLLSKTEFFRNQFKQHVTTAIIAAFSFLIALAWKDLIVDLADALINPTVLAAYPYLSALLSAIVISVIAVIGILLVTRWAKKPESPLSEKRTK